MINVKRALNDDRLMKSMTGLSASEFNRLTGSFSQEIQNELWNKYQTGVEQRNRKRKPGGGRIGSLKSDKWKLFFLLFYFKCYPTFDILGVIFDLNRSNSNRNIHKLTPALEGTLGRVMTLPKRKIRTLEELFEAFPEVKEIIIDGTERPIQRPKDVEKQKKNYSGKKKAHTCKNIVISNENRRISYLSPTTEGKNHDYGIFKEEFPPPSDIFPENVTLWMDLGFIGVEKDYPCATVMMPKKKPRGKELTNEEKKHNKAINRFRVVVEHAIGGVKRFRIVTDKFRNRKGGFDDKVMLISCGLWNYHLLLR